MKPTEAPTVPGFRLLKWNHPTSHERRAAAQVEGWWRHWITNDNTKLPPTPCSLSRFRTPSGVLVPPFLSVTLGRCSMTPRTAGLPGSSLGFWSHLAALQDHLSHCVCLLLRNGLSVESRRLSPWFPSFVPTHTSYIILTPEKHTASQLPSVINRHHVWCSFIWFPVLSLQFWCRW